MAGPIPLTEGEKQQLSALDVEAIEMFINFLKLIGLPKSVGEIYGLLFVSSTPLPVDALISRLGISTGAASQGLKLLRSFGAVKTVYFPGDRRDHYVADLELSRFASVFIKEELRPRVDRAIERLHRMEELMAELPPDERAAMAERIAKLRHWLEKGQTIMPWLLKFLVI